MIKETIRDSYNSGQLDSVAKIGNAYCFCGDAWAHDHSPETLLDAAKAILAWELEE